MQLLRVGRSENRRKRLVKDFYDSVGKSPVAYKGGSIEANLLRKLNIPSVNLEIYGCPKAEHLFNNMV